jgi:V/A-type H+/Na+-transporting ATPase subunit E
MAEELQGLLDRIRSEGLEKAESESKAIIKEATHKASTIVKEAETKAARLIAEAESEAQKFQQRSVSAVEQAARDVVLSVGDTVQTVFEKLIQGKTAEALDGDAFAKLLRDVILAYAQSTDAAGIDLLLNQGQQQKVIAYLQKELASQLQQGLQINPGKGILSGFSVVLRDKGIEHDFRGETLTDAFLQLLRPQLGEIVKKAMQNVKQTS